jgi:hypothetical protein
LVFQEIVQEKDTSATRFSFEKDTPATRFSFEKDVLLFEELVKERKVPRGNAKIDAETQCDISSQDNVYISTRDYIPPTFYRILYL